MEYSKQFNYQSITILFDKMETDNNYPNQYILTRTGSTRPIAFIPKMKLKSKVFAINDTYSVVSFGFIK